MANSPIKERLADDIKAAMKAGDKQRLSTLRNIHAAIKQREVDERAELDDAAVIQVLDRRAKQHRESLDHYRDAGRDDLAEIEEYELAIAAEYLPEAIGDDELEQLIDEAIAATGAASIRDMGKVMGMIKPKVQGRADMSAVSAAVKARLSD